MIDITLLLNALPKLLPAAIITLKIALFSTLLGLCGGTSLALLEKSSSKLIRIIVHLYIAIFRGTPMIVQIVFIYYSITFPLSPMIIAIIAIGLNSSAYISQIIKAGITAVDKGQIEAAQVLGFTNYQITKYIILPQALKTVLPAIGNELITLVKDSSLAYIIGVNELFKESRNLTNIHYDVLTLYFTVALFYFIITYTISLLISILERKWEKIC